VRYNLSGMQETSPIDKNQESVFFSLFWRDSSQWARASSFTRFLDYTQRRTTVDMTPLNELSARRRDLYRATLTTDRYPYLRWDSNPQSQQASGRRPTPQTALSMGPATDYI